MMPVPSSAPSELRRLLALFQSGDDAALRAALEGFEPSQTMLVGALCIGGTAFAARIAAAGPDGVELVLNAFLSFIEPPEGADADHETRLAQQLIERFELQARPEALFDTVRAEFLIESGPLEEVSQAVASALRHQQWAVALRGLERCRASLPSAPREIFGMAAMCLHKLGRYAEADRWIEEGLGDRAAVMAIGAVYSEDELLRRWGGDAKPVVTIICTTYNHERYVEQAIRGFLSQTCTFPFEILIHDDASTDRTQDVIRRWQAQYPRIVKATLQTQNQLSRGVRPFELLLAQARGEFVATCEGDDFWIDPAKLQRQVGFLQKNPEYSCSAHNYYHYLESSLVVKQWFPPRQNFMLTERQLMGVLTLLWFPTLVFRKTFTAMPPERSLSPIGDQFLTSWLGTQGRCVYFASMYAAVRRENEFSMWSPLSGHEKEKMRVKTWSALVRLHERLGNGDAVADLMAKINASSLDEAQRNSILEAARLPEEASLAEAA